MKRELVRHGEIIELPRATARAFDEAARSAGTRRAYHTDWRAFSAWCGERGFLPMPALPETVAEYLGVLALRSLSLATLSRRLSSISTAHRFAGHSSPAKSPLVEVRWAGIRRSMGRPSRGKQALLPDALGQMLATCDGSLGGLRDRALLLIGFYTASRRSELAALDIEDLLTVPEGLIVCVRRSKTDQYAEGAEKAVPRQPEADHCPVRAVLAWAQAARIACGPVFRSITRHGHVSDRRLSAQTVALVVKARARLAGIDPRDLSGHSLRVGFVTAAAAARVADRKIMEQTGHKNERTLRRYIRRVEIFRDAAASKIKIPHAPMEKMEKR